MPDAATTLIAQARAAGIIDERAAQTMLDLHRSAQATPDGPAGDRFGKFVLVEKIGEGGMGAVWRAYQTDLRRTVAVKFVKDDDPEILARFIREAHTAAGLTHPNIVATYEAGEHEGRHYIAMEYIEGQDLKKRRVDVPTALALMRDAANAVHYAHRNGIVHRDLKPANLMLDGEGRVRVMDFGLAKSEAAPGLSMTGTVVGTPYYMPPEQARGMPTDARSDVYALGATLYELVAGRPPFAGKTVGEVLHSVLDEEPERYVVGERVEENLVGVLEHLLRAKFAREKRRLLEEASIRLDLVRYEVRILHDAGLLREGAYGNFCEKLTEVGRPGSMKAGPSCGGGRLRRLAVRVGGQISS